MRLVSSVAMQCRIQHRAHAWRSIPDFDIHQTVAVLELLGGIEQDRDRAVVDERYVHVRLELAGFHVQAGGAELFHQV